MTDTSSSQSSSSSSRSGSMPPTKPTPLQSCGTANVRSANVRLRYWYCTRQCVGSATAVAARHLFPPPARPPAARAAPPPRTWRHQTSMGRPAARAPPAGPQVRQALRRFSGILEAR